MPSSDDPGSSDQQSRRRSQRQPGDGESLFAKLGSPRSKQPVVAASDIVGSGTPAAVQALRGATRRPPIHPLETTLLWVVSVHLVFVAWAVGTIRPWAQIPSCVLAGISLFVALWPRTVRAERRGEVDVRILPSRKLWRFPIFWLGLGYLAYVIVGGLNPAWEYRTSTHAWWMHAVPHIAWLPAGVRVPYVLAPGFADAGPWRNLVVYASAWMTACAIWVGLTRRRTLQRLFLVLVANGVALSLLGFAGRFAHFPYLDWFTIDPRASRFASFSYKNHGGAYLLLAATVTVAVGMWYYFRGLRRLEKSNPAGIFAFLALVIAAAVAVSYARGATLTLVVFLLLTSGGFIVHQLFFAPKATRKPAVLAAMLVVFGAFLFTGLRAVNVNYVVDRVKVGFEDGGDFSLRARLAATRATVAMFEDRWALGWGAGSFPWLFPIYQQREPTLKYFPGTTRPQFWPHAHNDWIEFPTDVGVVGMLFVLGSFGWYGLTLARNRFWRNPFSLVQVLGLVGVLFYSYWDFPFQCGAILITWVALWPAVTRWTVLEEREGRS